MKATKPDVFKGRPNEDVRMWLFTVEVYFATEETPPADIRKVAYAAAQLRENAAAWWRNVLLADAQIEDANLRVSTSWERFKARLTAQFSAVDFTKAARDKLALLVQKGSVSSYTYEFNRLINNVPNMTSEEAIHTYVNGLKDRVRIEVELRTPGSVEEAQRLATRVDEIMYRGIKRNPGEIDNRPRNHRSTNSDHSSSSYRGQPYTNGGPTPMELGFHDSRHNGSNMGNRFSRPRGRLSDAERASLIKDGKCFYCRKEGHIAINCPNKGGKGKPSRLTFADIVRVATDHTTKTGDNTSTDGNTSTPTN